MIYRRSPRGQLQAALVEEGHWLGGAVDTAAVGINLTSFN